MYIQKTDDVLEQ